MDAMAQCRIQEAERLSEESEIVAALLEAKAYNHRLEAYQAIARPLASDLSQRGEEALAAEQHQEAYPLLRDAVALDPDGQEPDDLLRRPETECSVLSPKNATLPVERGEGRSS